MAGFSERELTQLSFLVAWLAKVPAEADKLAEMASVTGERLAGVLGELQRRIAEATPAGAAANVDVLRRVSTSLLSDGSPELNAVGRLLANALQASQRLAKAS